jgi:hypothetical protein
VQLPEDGALVLPDELGAVFGRQRPLPEVDHEVDLPGLERVARAFAAPQIAEQPLEAGERKLRFGGVEKRHAA